MTLLVVVLVALGALLGLWFALAVLVDHLTSQGAVPERLAVRILPGWLPSYVREDLAHARQAREGGPRA
ncbi:hypothetical protein [Streptomyces sp. AK08-02]|uniref:hypothetical protein n=1 Tax=Streptomyces sp. AK08-02 TaxID=3028654 RepID=UPI0029A84598|nr:hypothetical protein [Streptomyces sp. AK08-02]MDX3748699.1 hypothetical protein [Streptomyces sp. AK08-02]